MFNHNGFENSFYNYVITCMLRIGTGVLCYTVSVNGLTRMDLYV
jgi:hypothetical protein